jgi:hypothetical protein
MLGFIPRVEISYLLHEQIKYFSPRYKKWVTVQPGEYDGSTGGEDVLSAGWLVHDQLCRSNEWDDFTHCTNWQASHVLYDILKSEGRWFRARSWFLATLCRPLVNAIGL